MIYKFTDTDKTANPGDLPGEALFINGQAIESQVLGYRTLYVKGREALSADVNLTEQGRADGSAYNFKRYPERVLTVGFQIIADDNEEYRLKFNQLGKILNVEQAQLVFNDETDKFFIGTPGEVSEIEAGSNKVTGEFNIVCADPFKYSVEEKNVTVSQGTPKTIYYNGTIPATPKISSVGILTPDGGQAMNYELFSINDNILVLFEDGAGGTYKSTLSAMETTTAANWTTARQYVTVSDDESRAEGVIMYKRENADAMYYARVYANMGSNAYSPMIEIARNFAQGIPTSELRFWVGDKIVYRQNIDDSGSNLFRFRISFSHTPTADAIAAGQMTGDYFFQFGDICYSFRDSWTWNAGSSASAITMSKFTREFFYENDHAITNYSGGIIWVWSQPIDKCGSQFPFNGATNIDPSTGSVKVLGLNTPRFLDPANRLDDFKIVPGENVFKCTQYGPATPTSFSATFKWREVFL